MKLYIRIFTNIEPDKGLFVGQFLGRTARESWRNKLPDALRALSRELGMNEYGITARTELCNRDSRQPAPAEAIAPDDALNAIRRQYKDIYATY